MVGLVKRFTAAAMLAAAAGASTGCEIASEVDRSHIPGSGGGSTTSTTTQSSTPTMDVCGDGVVRGAEQCDDGNTAAGDGCDASCQPEAGWTCDHSPSTCAPTCGDGKVIGGEACDDGNT